MKGFIKLPYKQLMWILTLSSLAIFLSSLDVITTIKDPAAYALWLEQIPELTASDDLYRLYTALSLSRYFLSIIIPMGFAIYTYFVHRTLRLNMLYVFMWALLLAGALATNLLGKSLTDPLFLAHASVYSALILTVLSLVDVINQRKVLS